MLRRNPPSVGIENGKSEPREEASGPREGHESLASKAQVAHVPPAGDMLMALAEKTNSTLRRPSVLRRNPPSVGIEKGKSESSNEFHGKTENLYGF